MTATEKMNNVAEQISDCMRGNSHQIICPYCGMENNSENNALCCKTFGDAVKAVLDRIRLNDVTEKVEQILEHAEMN